MERWRDIIETNGKYKVSDLGRVKNTETNRILKPIHNGDGYLMFNASFNSHLKGLLIHRVEYEAFIVKQELDSDIRVLHRNKNRIDNRLLNLCIGSDEADIPKNEHFKIISDTDGKYSAGYLGDIIKNYYVGKTNIRKLVPQNLDRHGYCTVDIYCSKIKKPCLVHRLVAKTFIPNPDNKPTVNHIDEVKTNNKVSNLEWMTTKEQNTYGKFDGLDNKLKLCTLEKRVIGIINDTVLFKFRSIHEASRQLNISEGNISECCNHRRKHAGRYHGQLISWEFLN